MAVENTVDWPSDPSRYEWKGTFQQSKSEWSMLAYCKAKKQDVIIQIRKYDISSEQSLDDIETFSKKIHEMINLKHPNLMTPLHCFLNKDKVWIIYRRSSGGRISELLSSHYPDGIRDVKLVATLLFHVVNGIHYLHQNRMNHRCIRPESILFDVELGIAILKMTNKEELKNIGIDPLLLLKDPQATWFHGDVFAIGITALHLVHGVPPQEYDYSALKESNSKESGSSTWLSAGGAEWYELIRTEMYDEELPFKSEDFENFIVQCTTEIENRHSTEDLLKHSLFTSNNMYCADEMEERIGHLFETAEMRIDANLSEPKFFRDEDIEKGQKSGIDSWDFEVKTRESTPEIMKMKKTRKGKAANVTKTPRKKVKGKEAPRKTPVKKVKGKEAPKKAPIKKVKGKVAPKEILTPKVKVKKGKKPAQKKKQSKKPHAPLEWDVHEAGEWVGILGKAYRPYTKVFVENGIDGKMLHQADDAMLKEIIPSKLHRAKIISAAFELFQH